MQLGIVKGLVQAVHQACYVNLPMETSIPSRVHCVTWINWSFQALFHIKHLKDTDVVLLLQHFVIELRGIAGLTTKTLVKVLSETINAACLSQHLQLSNGHGI